MSVPAKRVILIATLRFLLALLWCGTAIAAQRSIEIVPFCPDPNPDKAPVTVRPGFSYVGLYIVNIVNNLNKPWFANGDSGVGIGVEFEPLGSLGPTWRYAVSLNSVGANLSGFATMIPMAPRRYPIPTLAGGLTPILSANITELGRANHLKPHADGLNRLMTTVPNPYSPTAATVIDVASQMYQGLFAIWLANNRELIQLQGAGFTFIDKLPANGTIPESGNPLLGNVIYLLMGDETVNGQLIDFNWATQNLALDKTGRHLVYNKPVDLPYTGWNLPFSGHRSISHKKGDLFELASYALLEFDVSSSEFTAAAMFKDPNVQVHFQDAREYQQVRDQEWNTLEDSINRSNLLSFPDMVLVRSAFTQYMSAAPNCEDWTSFWGNCYKPNDPTSLATAASSFNGTASPPPAQVHKVVAEIAASKKVTETLPAAIMLSPITALKLNQLNRVMR